MISGVLSPRLRGGTEPFNPKTASWASPCVTRNGQTAPPFCLPIIMANPLPQAAQTTFTLQEKVAAKLSFSLSQVWWREMLLLLHSLHVPQQQGQPHFRNVHSTSKRSICPECLHPQQDLNKKKTSLTFNTQEESTASAVKRKISLQVRGVILFSKSTKVNKHSTLGCCFPKNFSSGERGSDSQALKCRSI